MRHARAEVWLPIALTGLDAWDVSTLGNFRRNRAGPGTFVGRTRTLVVRKDMRGKRFATISFPCPSGLRRRNGRRKMKIYKVSFLVCRTFLGPPPPKFVASHLNDVGLDNRLENLAWESRAANNRRRYINELAEGRRPTLPHYANRVKRRKAA